MTTTLRDPETMTGSGPTRLYDELNLDKFERVKVRNERVDEEWTAWPIQPIRSLAF